MILESLSNETIEIFVEKTALAEHVCDTKLAIKLKPLPLTIVMAKDACREAWHIDTV